MFQRSSIGYFRFVSYNVIIVNVKRKLHTPIHYYGNMYFLKTVLSLIQHCCKLAKVTITWLGLSKRSLRLIVSVHFQSIFNMIMMYMAMFVSLLSFEFVLCPHAATDTQSVITILLSRFWQWRQHILFKVTFTVYIENQIPESNPCAVNQSDRKQGRSLRGNFNQNISCTQICWKCCN